MKNKKEIFVRLTIKKEREYITHLIDLKIKDRELNPSAKYDFDRHFNSLRILRLRFHKACWSQDKRM